MRSIIGNIGSLGSLLHKDIGMEWYCRHSCLLREGTRGRSGGGEMKKGILCEDVRARILPRAAWVERGRPARKEFILTPLMD
jgi:hypothetical protein